MKTLFNLKAIPQYVYLTEDTLQQEYQTYLAMCHKLMAEGHTSICMFLNFGEWLDSMEYIVY